MNRKKLAQIRAVRTVAVAERTECAPNRRRAQALKSINSLPGAIRRTSQRWLPRRVKRAIQYSEPNASQNPSLAGSNRGGDLDATCVSAATALLCKNPQILVPVSQDSQTRRGSGAHHLLGRSGHVQSCHHGVKGPSHWHCFSGWETNIFGETALSRNVAEEPCGGASAEP